MAALFGHGNPLTTQIGQMIERATDGTQASENWGLFIEICDAVNETEDGPKDAIKAIRKRLSQNVGKNYTAVMYTLVLLETCVKNCARRFHTYVASKDFLQELIKIIGPKNDPPQVVQEKVLSLIQTWADAFRGTNELKEVDKVYQDLKGKGIEFPMTDLDNFVPIHTPARSAPESEPVVTRSGSSRMPRIQQPVPQQQFQPVATGPFVPTQEQMAKLHQELEVVQGNVRVLGEMLTELSPSNVEPANLELLQDLHRTCRGMQNRVVELIERVGNEEVTSELLLINDDLNNVFLRYERFERYRTGQPGAQTPTDEPRPSTPPASATHLPPSYDQLSEAANPVVGNLIDLDEGIQSQQAPVIQPTPAPLLASQPLANSDNIHLQLAGMDLGTGSVSSTLGQINTTTATNRSPANPEPEADFDMFAQSRKSFDQSKTATGGSTYQDQRGDQYKGSLVSAVNAKLNVNKDKNTEYDEMEKWLVTNPNEDKKEDSITSSEFDRFLADRAAAAENLPNITATTGSTQRPGQRQMAKGDDDNQLFAL